MDTETLKQFRDNLVEQRQNLAGWLTRTPDDKKQIHLGTADKEGVKNRLQVLDATIEKTKQQSFGRCEICHEAVEPDRLEIDYTCCVCLDHLSADAKKEIENELELAAKFQQALLPKAVPEVPGLEIAAYSRPAAVIGGDYFGFYHFRDGAHGLAIGDAVGHGISASLLMSNLHAALQLLIPELEAPGAVIQRVNHLFHHNINMTNFVTLFLARYEPDSNTLLYSSAGHNPALLLHTKAGGAEPFAWLQPTGPAVGLVESFQAGAAAVGLAPGDILLLYTDGVTEATNSEGAAFGTQRLAGLVQENAHLAVQDLVQALRQGLQDHSEGQPLADDATIVALKVGEV